MGHFYASSAIFILFLNTVASTVDSTQKLAQSAVETGKSYATGAKGNKCYKHDIQGASESSWETDYFLHQCKQLSLWMQLCAK